MKCQIHDLLKLIARELDIRTAEEFSTLNLLIRLKFPFSVPGIRVLPETFPIDSLGAYTNVSMTTDTLRTFQPFEEFTTINYEDCFEVKWSKDMTTLPTVPEMRRAAYRLLRRQDRAQDRALEVVFTSASRTHRGEERFPGMTITYALIQTVEKIAEKTEKAQIISSLTATLRFDGALNVDVSDPRTFHLSDVRDHLRSLGSGGHPGQQRMLEVVLPRT